MTLSESEKILEYLKNYAADNHTVLLSPTVSPIDGRVVSIEVSFNKKEYERGNFGSIIDVVYETSRHSAWIIDDWPDYYRGSFTIKVNMAHEHYSSERIIDTVEKLIGEVFPKLKKQ